MPTVRTIRDTTRGMFCRSCSQTRMTCQPSRRRAPRWRRSLALLSSIFSLHHPELVWGTLKWYGQPCQKQPSMKMHARREANTTSAVQRRSGTGLTDLRKRSPARCRALRKATSSALSGAQLACITRRTLGEEAAGARDRIESFFTDSPHPRQHPREVHHCRLSGLDWGRA